MRVALPSATNLKEDHVVAGLGGYPHTKKVEPAGRTYFRRCKNAARGRTMSHDSTGGDGEIEAARLAEEEILKKYRKSIKGKDFIQLTMYQQLGIADIGFSATEEQIKKAYHRVLIEHHPDKTGKTENDPNYLAVQKAFNTLMDPQKRRAYDSQCNFDESIPSATEKILQHSSKDLGGSGEDEGGVCFYKLYGPVFERNGRFSTKQPVPKLGDDTTDIDTVYSFYNFWHKFDSWRDFTHDAEHDVDSAEHRDEKRYLMKKNIVVAKKKKKKEYLRLSALVDQAMSADPRVRRVKFQEKESKRLAKLAKEEAKKREEDAVREAEEAKLKAIQDAENKQKEEAKAAKYQREMAKKAMRKAKKSLRGLLTACRSADPKRTPDVEGAEELCDNLSLEDLKSLSDGLGSEDNVNLDGLTSVREKLVALKGEDWVAKKEQA